MYLIYLCQETFKTETSKAKQKSLPRSLFCGKFGLSQEAFEVGLAAGDFFEVQNSDGRVTYTWQQDEHATIRGTSSSHKVSGEKKLSQQEFELEKIAMGSWKFGLFKKNPTKALGSQSTKALAIEDMKCEISDKAWEAAQKQLLDAQSAMEKLIKDGKKHLQTIGPDCKEDPIYGNLKLSLYFSMICISNLHLVLAYPLAFVWK